MRPRFITDAVERIFEGEDVEPQEFINRVNLEIMEIDSRLPPLPSGWPQGFLPLSYRAEFGSPQLMPTSAREPLQTRTYASLFPTKPALQIHPSFVGTALSHQDSPLSVDSDTRDNEFPKLHQQYFDPDSDPVEDAELEQARVKAASEAPPKHIPGVGNFKPGVGFSADQGAKAPPKAKAPPTAEYDFTKPCPDKVQESDSPVGNEYKPALELIDQDGYKYDVFGHLPDSLSAIVASSPFCIACVVLRFSIDPSSPRASNTANDDLNASISN